MKRISNVVVAILVLPFLVPVLLGICLVMSCDPEDKDPLDYQLKYQLRYGTDARETRK